MSSRFWPFLVRTLPVTPIERNHLERGRINSLDTAQVHVDLIRVGARNVERRDAARLAEMMLRDARVERVGRQLFPGCQQAEAFAGYDPMEISLLRANRAVAFDRMVDLAFDLVPDATAMASALFQMAPPFTQVIVAPQLTTMDS